VTSEDWLDHWMSKAPMLDEETVDSILELMDLK
jgi:hypothetical protein